MATKAETPMPPANADLQTTWAYLEEGVNYIMTHPREDLSFVKLSNLSAVIYNYCLSSRMSGNLNDSVGLGWRTGTNLIGSYLYHNLIRYFVGHLTELRNTSESMVDEALLRYYAREWGRYTTGANCVNRLFAFLNRHWLQREKDEGRKNVHEVGQLALMLWKLHVVENTRLVSAVLEHIKLQRNGETIDEDRVNVVKKVIDSFVPLYLSRLDNETSLEVYMEHFVDPFIAATEEYYKAESDRFMAENTVSDYFKRAEERLEEENNRVKFYLNENHLGIIIQVCADVWVQKDSQKVSDGFRRLFDEYDKTHSKDKVRDGDKANVKDGEEKAKDGDDEVNDLQRMYTLLTRIPQGLQLLQKHFEDHVKRAGQQVISKIVAEGGINVVSLEPKAYLHALLEVRRKYESTVEQLFGGSERFVAALDKACRDFVNRNHTEFEFAVLRLIESQRNGEAIDQEHVSVVKSVVDSFAPLDGFDSNEASLEVYKGHFVNSFIAATEKDYYTKYMSLLGTTLTDYLNQVEELLRIEEQIQFYLNANTGKIIMQKCERLFIQEYLERMWDDFHQLLDFDKYEDLQRMFALLARIPEGLESLRKKFEEHVKRAGQQAISRLVGEGGSNADSLEPKVYVDALLEVYRKNRHNVQRGFKNEMGFVAALDKACRDFVNRNAATGTSITRSPELLAKHVDALLHKSNKLVDESELENALTQVMVLFKYINDKDVFRIFYTTKLSKRLIHNVSASDEAEASMISKLKDACGFEYTNKLQRMFTDRSLSKDLTDQFKEHIEQSGDTTGGDITFGIMVLGTNFWPLNAPAHEFVIPREIIPTYERFTRYYRNKHSGRKLIWLWNYSRNELRTNYLNRKYILMTSSHQMAVLIQYNTSDTLSLDEFISATGINKDLLVQILGVLVNAKVLVNGEIDQYDLNPNFNSEKIRVNVNRPIKAEVKAEAVDVLKAVDEERKYVMQTTIVRIMKARKTLKNQALIAEVVSQISQRFTPKIGDIKKAIETLLEKEYIERAEGQSDTYNYLA